MTPIPPSPPVAGNLPELPDLRALPVLASGVAGHALGYTADQMRTYATAALSAHEAEVGRLRGVLEETQRVLAQHNGTAITDTLWRGPAETLFDYIDAALTQGETK